MSMVTDLWNKVQEFVGRLSAVEQKGDATDKELTHLKREVEIMQKSFDHSDKVQAQQGKVIAELEARIKALESKNRGLAISAGKAKAKAARLEVQAKH